MNIDQMRPYDRRAQHPVGTIGINKNGESLLDIFYFFKSRLCYNWVLEQENLYLVVVTR